ncbi:hypothetical protein CNEO3_110103 [Clostridium neonatale]|nr:hypothetical protein CNEO3_110103 [Clostridium neonatale]
MRFGISCLFRLLTKVSYIIQYIVYNKILTFFRLYKYCKIYMG